MFGWYNTGFLVCCCIVVFVVVLVLPLGSRFV